MDTPVSDSSGTGPSGSMKPSESSVSKQCYSSSKCYETDLPICTKLYDRDVNCTPSTMHKVKTWINSLNSESINSNSDEGELDFYGFDNTSNMETKLLHFNKSDKIAEDEVRHYYKPYLTSARCQKHTHPKSIKKKIHTLLEVRSSKSSKSNKSEFDHPLSPESEKKKELCSYLQLMKPTDKKAVTILQNRRSVRVKNLSILQEKRELEKKLREESSETSHEDDVLKLIPSDDERIMDHEKNGGTDETFKFPAPQKHLVKMFHDFSEVMDGDWFKGWKTQSAHSSSKVDGDSLVKPTKQKEHPAAKLLSDSEVALSKTKSIDEFTLPKPPPLLARSITDFADTIQKEDLPFGYKEDSPIRVKSPKKPEISKNVKEVKLSIPFRNLGDEFIKAKPTMFEEKFSSPLITKITSNKSTHKANTVVSPKNVKKKSTKNKSPIKFQSSFKIKLFTKKKSTPTKVNNSSASDKTEIANLKVIKENLKVQSDIECLKNKKLKVYEVLKSPLRDTNDNKDQLENELPHQNSIAKCPTADQKQPQQSTTTTESQSTILAAFTYKEGAAQSNDVTPSQAKTEFLSQIMDIEKSSEDEDNDEPSGSPLLVSVDSLELVEPCNNTLPTPFIAFNNDKPDKPLHGYLTLSNKPLRNAIEPMQSTGNWVLSSPSSRQRRDQHSIHIQKTDGQLLKVFYVEYNLVVCQEHLVSFWTQTALGHVLGAQNMWLNKGSIQRLTMSDKCTLKESLEMVISTETNFAYLELWTKEHQSEIREGPVADIFAVVYFWMKGRNGLDKKVLQLENIRGFADDVQYSVLKSTPMIVVSWHLTSIETESKKSFVHCYQLAADFQSVGNISEFEAVEHYVSSLHNIEGSDTLIMGCGENKITLWNVERGYVLATVEMLDIKSPLSTLWVKCDRGFLFTLQQCVDKELRLIAIHGMNHTWKKLASYVPPEEYDRLKGVCVENGIVVACYDQGIVCWNAHTAQTIVEAPQRDAHYISGRYMISIIDDQVNLKHAITHLLSIEDQSL